MRPKNKLIVLLLLLAMAGCKEQDRPKFKQQWDLPPGHSLYYSREKKGWLPVYHWYDTGDTVFLVYIPDLDYVYIFWTKSYAVGYPTRDSAIRIIYRHWNDMEKERKRHEK